MKKPFVIKDVENIVMEATAKHNDTHPQLVAQFPCQNVIEEDNCITLQLFKYVRVYIHVCRSVLSVTNATQVTINGISISVETSVVSAVTLQQCSHVHIMSINLTSNDEQCDNSPTSEGTNVGVLAYECYNVEVELLQANKFSDGVVLYNTSSTNITEITVVNSSRSGAILQSTSNTIVTKSHVLHNAEDGIALLQTRYTHISSVSSINNGQYGLRSYDCSNTTMTNITSADNQRYGTYLGECSNTTMINITSAHNQRYGTYLGECSNTTMINITSAHNQRYGVVLGHCSNTTMINITSAHNQRYGVVLGHCSNTTMINITSAHNQRYGVVLGHCSNTTMINITSAHNQRYGVVLGHCSNTTMINITSAHNQSRGVYLDYCNNTTMSNITSAHNQGSGVFLFGCSNTMINITSAHNQRYGVVLGHCSNTTMINITSAHNQRYGVVLGHCSNTTMINITSAHNQSRGVYLDYCNNTTMSNITSAHNQGNGVDLLNCSSTTMINITSAHNQRYGVVLGHCSNTTMINITSAHNQSRGVYLDYCNNTTMSNITSAQNQWDGVDLLNCSSTTMINITSAHNQRYGVVLGHCSNTTMINITSAHNQRYGIVLGHCSNTTMINITSALNQWRGVYLDYCNNTTMSNITSAHNQGNGVFLFGCSNTTMINITSAHNQHYGTNLGKCSNTTMINITSVHNQWDGVNFGSCSNTTMINITSAQNQWDGVDLLNCSSTTMINITSAHNQWDGVVLVGCSNTMMINITSAHNQHYGTHLGECSNTTMINITSHHNQWHGITVVNGNDTKMMNVTAKNNQNDGITVRDAYNTSIDCTSVFHNKGQGMILISSNVTRITKYSSISSRKQELSVSGSDTQVGAIELFDAHSTYITNTVFSNIHVPLSTSSSTEDPTTLPAVISLFDSNLTISNSSFTGNTISCIKAVGSTITIVNKVTFSNNSAYSGTGFILAKSSTLVVREDSNVIFKNNHAINNGGIFYIATEETYGRSLIVQDIPDGNQRGSLATSETKCFVRVEGNRSHTRLTFINNTAEKGGDVLHGGLVALGWDGNWNCLLSFKNISNMSESLSTISSAPSRVCICNETGYPNCLTVVDPIQRSVYPGETITIPAVVVGQDFGTVSGSVHAQITKPANLQVPSSVAVQHRQCSDLDYTIFSKSEETQVVLILTADDKTVSQLIHEDYNTAITNSWSVLNSDPDYNKLASEAILRFINPLNGRVCDFSTWQISSTYDELSNNTITNFYKFTPNIIQCLAPRYIHNRLVFPKEIYGYPVYIHISFRPCPPGFNLTDDRCNCNQQLQQLPGVKCHIQGETVTRSGLVWIGTDGNDTQTSYNCPYNLCTMKEVNITLDDSDSQCNLNHSGTLCGGCQSGLSLVLGSNTCLECRNTYLALLLVFPVAGIALVFFIKVLDLTVPQGTLNGLIFYVNIVKANEHLLLTNEYTTPLTLFIAWLNLDLGIETCFFNGLTAYIKTWLQFVFPLYVWSIAALIIVLAKYSDRVAKMMGNNSVPVLATLFLLSYAKLFRTIITALSFSVLRTTQGDKAVWSADGNIEYLGAEHAPLFTVATAALLFLWLPYTLLLFLGQWLYRCKFHLVARALMKIKPFMDVYHGPLNGNHRYWFGALLFIRAILLLMSALVPTNLNTVVIFSITVSAVSAACYAPFMYQSLRVSAFEAVWFLNLGLLSASRTFTTLLQNGEYPIASNLFIGVAFAQFITLILFKIFPIMKRVKTYLFKKWSIQENNGPKEDDWELYEEAALLREREAEREINTTNEGRESCENSEIELPTSTVSLPTYGF